MYQLFRYLLSFIGIASEHEGDKSNQGKSSSCSFMTESTLFVYKEEDEKYDVIRPSWIRRLSKMAFCHILTWTATEYPIISYNDYDDDAILSSKDKGGTKENKEENQDNGDYWISKIHSIQEKGHAILDPLCSISRPSEQFEMAPRAAELLYDVIKQCSQQKQQHVNDNSFSTLFGLILLAQQCLETPMEVRQHFFLQAKLGRVLILDLSSLLKNFKLKPDVDMDDAWKQVLVTSKNSSSGGVSHHWFDHLKNICKKLEKYDKNWEYREEYQQVITLAKKQFII